MAAPLFERGEEVEDIGSVMKPRVTVFDILENFGGFGKHYYMVRDREWEEHLRTEISLRRIENESDSCQPLRA